MENQKILGIIAIILGILVIAFPLFSELVLSVIAGLGFAILGIYYILAGSHSWSISKWTSVAYIILGIVALIFGFMLLFNVYLFEVLIGIYIYITGFMLLFSGILGMVYKEQSIGIAGSAGMLIMGILVLILGFLALNNPLYVAFLIGLSLIFDGVTLCFTKNYL
jgi:membrane protein HdeD